MDDREIRQTFFDDLIDKNQMARSSRISAATRSSFKKYGILKEKYKKNKKGDYNVDINMNKYVSWKDFLALPKDLKEQYIQGIVDKYKIGSNGVARLWSGEVSRETVRKLYNTLNIVSPLPVGKRPSLEDANRFLKDFKTNVTVLENQSTYVPKSATRVNPNLTSIRLLNLINKTGKSLKQTADGMGLGISTLSEIINHNRRPSSKTIEAICNYFNVSARYILGLEDNTTQIEIAPIEVTPIETEEETLKVEETATDFSGNNAIAFAGDISFALLKNTPIEEVETEIHKYLSLFNNVTGFKIVLTVTPIEEKN